MSASDSQGAGGASGANAGQDAKGIFNAAKGAVDDLRGNINSFADQAIGTHGREDKDRHGVTLGATPGQTTSTGFSKDAEALGNAVTGNTGSNAK